MSDWHRNAIGIYAAEGEQMRITQRSVATLVPKRYPFVEWDDDTKGFGVKVAPTGTKTFIVKYRIGRTQKKKTLGRVNILKTEEARGMARRLIAAASEGIDAVEEERTEREAPLVEDLAIRFLRDYAPFHLKPSTAADYERSIRLFIVPRLGKHRVDILNRQEIANFHLKMAKTPYQANRVLGTLSIMLTQAEIWGMRPEGVNPCLRVKRFKEHKRERFLSSEELSRLARALNEEAKTKPIPAAAFRLLILTGCRMGEIQKLKWEHVDFEREELWLPDTKTGDRTVYLSAPAIGVLRSIPKLPDNPYVITGTIEGNYLTDLQRPWRRIRKAAGLEDVRIHDLRHTYAANAAASGLSLPMIGKLCSAIPRLRRQRGTLTWQPTQSGKPTGESFSPSLSTCEHELS